MLPDGLLAPGETVVVTARAKLHQPPRSSTRTWVEFHFLMWLVYRARYRRRMDEYVELVRRAGFPVTERMIVAATDRRLVFVGATGRGFRPGEVSGAIERADIDQIWWPRIGGGTWRTLALRTRAGGTASVLISKPDGDALIEAF